MNAPKAVQITWMGKPLRRVYPHATTWQVVKYKFFRAVRKVLQITLIASLFVLAALIGYAYNQGSTISATNVIMQDTQFPILHKIAVAESGDSQVGKDGQVIVHINTNGTYDIGRYQVNSIWNARATKMGYNLYIEKDNEAFARYLFTNFGSEPWSSSKARWNK